MPQWAYAFWCYNISVIGQSKPYAVKEWRPRETLNIDWDLIAPIHHFLNLLPGRPAVNHVYGH